MEKAVEDELRNGLSSQSTSLPKPASPVQPSALRNYIWKIVNLNNLGSLPNKKIRLVFTKSMSQISSCSFH